MYRLSANKRGNFGYQRKTDARLTTTIRNAARDELGLGGTALRTNRRDQTARTLAARALDKCARWSKPVRLDPDKYTVVLEPTAVGDLVTYIWLPPLSSRCRAGAIVSQ